MPGVLSPVSYEPIKAVRVLSSNGATPQMIRESEDATQTWQIGVPVRLVTGNLQECTFSAADVIYGVSAEHAHNLTTANTPTQENEQSPPNQPSAITTAVGAWMRDGKCGVYGANGQTVFSVALKAGQVFTQALLVPGTYYRLIKDNTSGFWYLDNTLTGGNAGVANLLGFDSSCPNTVAGGCRVFFQFIESQRFFQ